MKRPGPSPALPSVTQITTRGRGIEAKNAPITAADLAFDPGAPAPRSAYLHIPFCFHKCHYCDFYSIVDTGDRHDRFVARMREEIEAVAGRLAAPAVTIFVGGGTPTLLSTGLWGDLGRSIQAGLGPNGDTEFTVEANPETVTPEVVAALVEAGVNRMSVGAQSFDPAHLETLERWHDPESVPRAIERARDGGIDNVSLDLIFGIPGQSVADWERDLDAALALAPQHVSCYGLTYEPNTAMTARLRAGRIEPSAPEVEAAMYEATLARLGDAGFEHYEISNWARPGFRCRHNLAYWRNETWWAFGPSASGHAGGWRWKNAPRIGDYVDSSGLPPIVDAERLGADARVGEALMLGLRLREGFDEPALDALIAQGRDDRRVAIERHVDGGLLERADGRVRLSRRGLLLADDVLADLV
jgi:oxygen-independent coproporphyrinogen-3 oxidase